MTSKQRMLAVLARQTPDRLPVTVHQWQRYHLEKFMGGIGQIEAFRRVGLDASITPGDVMRSQDSQCWRERVTEVAASGPQRTRRDIHTPSGDLSYTTATDEFTTYLVDHPIKTLHDLDTFAEHWPAMTLDRDRLADWYERTGDSGIVRGFVASFIQPGCWQELCELAGTEQAIFWAMDEPGAVHQFLLRLSQIKTDYVRREMRGAKYDLIEHGGGAASSTVISPAMFDQFVVPYDRPIIEALHEAGFPVVYHTCGGMMAILDRIPATGCDASETLSPPGVGGDIAPALRMRVKESLGAKVALIGGVDQGELLRHGTPQQIRDEVRALFETFGKGGAYICSASDHFFDVPVENLVALAEAGKACSYR